MSLLFLWIAAAQASEGRVEGVIRYGAIGVGGVTVQLAGADGGKTVEVTTGLSGAFVVPLPAGHYTMTVAPGSPGAATAELDLVDDALVEADAQTDGTQTPAIQPKLVPPADPSTATARLSGEIRTDAGERLAGARVYARGWPVGWGTDTDGEFVGQLPPGTYDLLVASPGYETTLEKGVTVPSAEPVTIDLYATETESVAGMTIAVEQARIRDDSAALLAERRNSTGVTDVVAAGSMTRAGDSDAASALRRVTGLSVVSGKYVFVRGLGDRYSTTTLNGSLLPSPEPEKRVVPLDLFPAVMLDGVVIQKTPSPDRPGEFGGGIVELRTRSVPERPTFSLGVNGSWVAGTTGVEALDAPRGPTDWLGFGRAWRALPEGVATASEPLAPQSLFSDGGFTDEELEAYGESFPHHWAATPRTLPPDLSITTSGGGRWHLGGGTSGGATLGVLVGGVYSNSWSTESGYTDNFSVTDEGTSVSRQTQFDTTRNTIRLGAMGTVELAWGKDDHVTSVTLFDRDSEASAERWTSGEATGTGDSFHLDTQDTRVGWLEQQFLFEQLGTHLSLGPLVVDGHYALAFARRDEPDQREADYGLTDDGAFLNLNGTSNEMRYSALDDHAQTADLQVAWPVRLPSGDARFALGGGFFSRARASETRRFTYEFHGTDGIDLSAPPEDIFTDENIGATDDADGGWTQISELTVTADDYTAEQHNLNAYVLADVPWTFRIRTLLGARIEQSHQGVSTYERFSTDTTPVEGAVDSTDILPSATATFGIAKGTDPSKMMIRVGYGRTLSRPELRELSEVPYYDYRSRRLNFGNPDLEQATIDNVDLRWELYPRDAETFSVGAFYKHFQDPIEAVVSVSSVSGDIGTFANADSASNVGVEAELRQGLDVLSPALGDFYVSANGAYIRSRVDLSSTEGQQTSESRPLQGQSPYLVNLLLGWDHEATGTVVNIVFNEAGPRIVQVGTSGIPDTYELPVHQLDALVTQSIGDHWKIRAKGTNLLVSPKRERTGDVLSQQVDADWSVSLGVVWTPL